MLLNKFWRRWMNQTRTNRQTRRRTKPHSRGRVALRLELLEDRIVPSSFPTDSADWMKAMPDSTPLSQISIPGTHDTMTYTTVAQVTPETATQEANYNVNNQLNNGIRFFDIRAQTFNTAQDPELYHGPIDLKLKLGNDVFDPTIEFLQNHKDETVIISISDIGTYSSNTDPSTVGQWVQNFAENNDNSQYFYFDPTNQVPTLGDVRGRIVVFRRYDYTPPAADTHGSVGLNLSAWPENSTQEIPLGPGGAHAVIEDQYGFPDFNFNNDIAAKWSAVMSNITNALGNPDPNNWYITLTSASEDGKFQDSAAVAWTSPFSPSGYALGNAIYSNPINLQLTSNNDISAGIGGHLGIVAMDFPDLQPWQTGSLHEYSHTPNLVNDIVLSNFEPLVAIPQKISFNTLPDQTYGSGDFELTASASSELPVSFAAYNVKDSTLTPAANVKLHEDSNGNWFAHIIGTGSVTIVANQAGGVNGGVDFLRAPQVDQTFTINPATPILSVSDGGGTYNRNPFPATGTALGLDDKTPVSGTWSFSYYNGIYVPGVSTGSPSSRPPFDPGTYTVIGNFTSSDPNYASSSSAPIVFTITGAAPTLTVSDAGGVYDGGAFAATGTALGLDGPAPIPGSFSYAYYSGSSATGASSTTAPTDAGAYTVVATFTSRDPKYSDGTAQTTFTIAPAAPKLTISGGGVYNGNPIPATGTALGVDGSTPVSGTWHYLYYNESGPVLGPFGPRTNAGTYTVVGSFASSDPNYTGGTAQTTFTISPIAPTARVVDAGGAYNGNPFAATGIALGLDGVTPVSGAWSYAYYSGVRATGVSSATAPSSVGTYTVVATFTSSDPNYTGATVAATFTIKPAFAPTPPAPPTLHLPTVLAFFESVLGAVETINADETVTETVRLFGIPLLVSHFDSTGRLESVDLFGINVTSLFESL